MNTFPHIDEYGFLSNCEQSCLVAPDGSVEWLCLPRPDSPSVFGALLDRAAGLFRFGPSGARVPQQRRYVPGTMVLETTWQTPTGWMIVQDFLAVGPVEAGARRPDYHRAPTDTGALGALVRIATCISGRVEVAVNCAPLFNYGTAGGTWSYQGDGYDAMTVAAKEGDVQLELAGSIRLGLLGARGYGRSTLTEGQSAYVVLSWGDATVPASEQEAFSVLDRADGQEVLHGHPSRAGLPGGLQHHRPRHVSALLRHLGVARAEPEQARRPVQERTEHARRVGTRQAQPLDRPVRGDQAALLAIGKQPVLGNGRKCAHRCLRHLAFKTAHPDPDRTLRP